MIIDLDSYRQGGISRPETDPFADIPMLIHHYEDGCVDVLIRGDLNIPLHETGAYVLTDSDGSVLEDRKQGSLIKGKHYAVLNTYWFVNEPAECLEEAVPLAESFQLDWVVKYARRLIAEQRDSRTSE